MNVKPCIICQNKNVGELSKHHLIPKVVQKDVLGCVLQKQKIIKLCRDNLGCRTHHQFHLGDKDAAVSIRIHLRPNDVTWMVDLMGQEWVNETYPLD